MFSTLVIYLHRKRNIISNKPIENAKFMSVRADASYFNAGWRRRGFHSNSIVAGGFGVRS